jgi:predicted NBD/HSP70 family sugar kinase
MLTLIRERRARTIAELAAAMDMARSTVAQRVDQLLDAGLILVGPPDDAEAPSGRGRRAAVLQFNPSSGAVLVAQLGMTGVRVAVTDLVGHILTEQFHPFAIESGPTAVIDHLESCLASVLEESRQEAGAVRGLGIGIPSATELSAGRASRASTDNGGPWVGFPVTERLEATFGVPVFVDNDVNLLALGEQRMRWPDTDVLLCLKVGSVIGCGTVIRGRVVTGAQGVAGGIGHLPVPGDDTPCFCGNLGCLDAVASGRALVIKLRSAGITAASARDVAALASAGIPEAAQAIRDAGRSIGEVLSHAVNLLNPGVVAVWGYLAEAEQHLLAGIRESVYQRALPAATHSLNLVGAQNGDGLSGAAIMVLSQILSPGALDKNLTIRALKAASPLDGMGEG